MLGPDGGGRGERTDSSPIWWALLCVGPWTWGAAVSDTEPLPPWSLHSSGSTAVRRQ